MWIAISVAIAGDPVPFLRGAPSSQPVDRGHGVVEVAAGHSAPLFGIGAGGDAVGVVAVHDQITLNVHGDFGIWHVEGPVDWSEAPGGVSLAVRATLFQAPKLAFGVWTRARYGRPLLSSWKRRGWEPALGVSFSARAGIWTVDASVSVFSVPIGSGALRSGKDVFGREAWPIDLFRETTDRSLEDLRVASTWDVHDRHALRLAFEPLPTFSYRYKAGKHLVVEPALGFGYTALNLEAHW